MAERVVVYIDGLNLYFGVKASNWRRYYWLDLVALAQNLLKSGQSLEAVHYFTARVSQPSDKAERQTSYLEALAMLPRLTISYGKFLSVSRQCPHCRQKIDSQSEQMTDVNIAVELLGDAYQDRYDMALLISGDSDLVPPVTMVRRLFPRKRIVVAFPPKRHSVDLANAAAAYFTIGRKVIADSQLPDTMTIAEGFAVTRPERWR